uniref:Uncharacterized protein n=1 Tax=Arundo donax TaxID=35708 RepID=A0A0A8YA06_ARUDO
MKLILSSSLTRSGSPLPPTPMHVSVVHAAASESNPGGERWCEEEGETRRWGC